MSVKSAGSLHEPGGPIVCAGYLKKLKTSKKKWFVLRSETCESPARLEYYDSEKKFNGGQPPKRIITLRTCFNINKRSDTKYKYVIALYTKDDCFCVVLDTEEELDVWLKALLSLQHGEEVTDGETPKPTFEHVWHVKVLDRGLGGTALLCGRQRTPESSTYRLCLTDKTLSLIRKDHKTPQTELALSSIRTCGSLKNYFYLELGRSSAIGAGELWMEPEDANIAQNVHQIVLHAMTSSNNSSKEDLYIRNRSCSATESSKPTTAVRRQTHSGVPKPMSLNQDTPNSNESLAHLPATSSSSTRTVAGGVSWPGIVNHQRTQSLPLANPAPSIIDHHTSNPPRASQKRPNQSSKCGLNSGGRERCDSMPSRARTTSEGNHGIPIWSQRLCHPQFRPQSLHVRDISHSPPSGSPVSPPSATCSTDSAGSSLSIDESEPWPEPETVLGRYSNSLTPDEAIAEIDERPDSPLMRLRNSPMMNNYVQMAPISSDDGYVDMSPKGRHVMNMSPAASTSSVTSGTPSTDLRFAEFHLDKVSSYFTPSEDEACSGDRPIRAYSVGSRPETCRYVTRLEMSNTPENSRTRAFSVGSKSKKVYSRVLPPHGAGGSHSHPGVKSSSAPILSNSRIQSSHSSIDPMDYLMEVDFSKRKVDTTTNSGYVEMKPAGNKTSAPAPSGYVEMKPCRMIQETPASSYMDMRTTSGTSPLKSSCLTSAHENLPFIDSDGSPQARNNTPHNYSRNDYMDMSSKPSPPSVPHDAQTDYMDMNFQQHINNKSANDRSASQMSTSPMRGSAPQGSPNNFDYMDMEFHNQNPRLPTGESFCQTSDGYVEMTLGKQQSNHQRQSSLDSAKPNMISMDDGSGNTSSRKKEKKVSKKEKARSLPITIQWNSGSQAKNTNCPMCPKMYLPLSGNGANNNNSGHFSSLPRQRSRKNSRRDSKETSSSSVTTATTTTTPSSSSTMFPISINSPVSPAESKTSTEECVTRRQSLDDRLSSSKTATEKTQQKMDDYVNYSPAFSESPIRNEENRNYAVMRPGNSKTNETSAISKLSLADFDGSRFKPISEPGEDSRSLTTSPRPGDLPPVDVIQGADENAKSAVGRSNCEKSRPASVTSESGRGSLSRPSSTSSELGSSASTVVGSRPPSANSERTRPSSVSSDVQLHYASLDLAKADEESGSRSPRLVKMQLSDVTTTPEPASTYAEIDFLKSEGFKHNPLAGAGNTRVKY